MKVNVVNLIIFSYSSGCRKRKKRKSGPEEEIVVAYGCRKGKKRICGPEEEIVVAHGHQLSSAHTAFISDLYVNLGTLS